MFDENKIYLDIAKRVIDHFGSPLVKLADLRKVRKELKYPLWVYSYCKISKNELYFSTDMKEMEEFGRHKNYTQEEFDSFAEIVYNEYSTLIISTSQLLKLRNKDVKIPFWARYERIVAKGKISFEKDFKPWYPKFELEL